MSRASIDYRASGSAQAFTGFDPDVPIAGFYRTRLRSGAPYVGVRIWYGQPLDPVTGEEMDRSLRWQAQANGSYVDLDRVWPKCAGDPITEAEHAHLIRVQQWAESNAPDSALADPRRRIDPLSSPMLF